MVATMKEKYSGVKTSFNLLVAEEKPCHQVGRTKKGDTEQERKPGINRKDLKQDPYPVGMNGSTHV